MPPFPVPFRRQRRPTSPRLRKRHSPGRVAFAAGALLAAGLALAAHGHAAEPPHPFGPGDLAAVRDVSDPRLSPDGAWVAYVVRTSDTEEDRVSGDLWMTSWDGARTIQLTRTPKDNESTPRWSPDGKRLALIASDPDSVEPAADAKDKDRNRKKTPKPIVIDRYWFKQDRAGYLRRLRGHLYLFDVANEKATLLTPGDYDEASPAWPPDGTRIAFVSKREGDPDRNENSDVFVIEARPDATPLPLTRFEGADSDPRWSPDGESLAFLRGGPVKYRDYDPAQLAVVPAKGGDARLVAAGLDRAASRPAWSPDGRSLLFLVEDDRSQQLARVPSGGGAPERLTATGAVVQAFSAVDDRTSSAARSAP